MRDQTRHYTHQLPRLTLADLKAMRRMFADGSTALQKETSVGVVRFTAKGTDYRAEIGGKVLPLRFCETVTGYGVRLWYCCPHCNSRRASLFVGARDIACRECWGLHYASQSEGKFNRMRRRIRKMRAELWPDYKPAISLFNHPYLFPKRRGCDGRHSQKNGGRWWRMRNHTGRHSGSGQNHGKSARAVEWGYSGDCLRS